MQDFEAAAPSCVSKHRTQQIGFRATSCFCLVEIPRRRCPSTLRNKLSLNSQGFAVVRRVSEIIRRCAQQENISQNAATTGTQTPDDVFVLHASFLLHWANGFWGLWGLAAVGAGQELNFLRYLKEQTCRDPS